MAILPSKSCATHRKHCLCALTRWQQPGPAALRRRPVGTLAGGRRRRYDRRRQAPHRRPQRPADKAPPPRWARGCASRPAWRRGEAACSPPHFSVTPDGWGLPADPMRVPALRCNDDEQGSTRGTRPLLSELVRTDTSAAGVGARFRCKVQSGNQGVAPQHGQKGPPAAALWRMSAVRAAGSRRHPSLFEWPSWLRDSRGPAAAAAVQLQQNIVLDGG